MNIKQEKALWLARMERRRWMQSIAQTARADKDDSSGGGFPPLEEGQRWVTINGSHVLIDGDGRIVAGAEGKLNDTQLKNLKEHHQKNPPPDGSSLHKPNQKLLHAENELEKAKAKHQELKNKYVNGEGTSLEEYMKAKKDWLGWDKRVETLKDRLKEENQKNLQVPTKSQEQLAQEQKSVQEQQESKAQEVEQQKTEQQQQFESEQTEKQHAHEMEKEKLKFQEKVDPETGEITREPASSEESKAEDLSDEQQLEDLKKKAEAAQKKKMDFIKNPDPGMSETEAEDHFKSLSKAQKDAESKVSEKEVEISKKQVSVKGRKFAEEVRSRIDDYHADLDLAIKRFAGKGDSYSRRLLEQAKVKMSNYAATLGEAKSEWQSLTNGLTTAMATRDFARDMLSFYRDVANEESTPTLETAEKIKHYEDLYNEARDQLPEQWEALLQVMEGWEKEHMVKAPLEQKQAKEAYVDGDYRKMNMALNSGKGDYSHTFPETKKLIEDFESLIDSSELPEDLDVFRGFGMPAEQFDELAVGGEMVNHGFSSMSTNFDVSEGFMTSNVHSNNTKRKVMVHVSLKKGTKCLPATSEGEDEVILQRGARMKIVKMSEGSGRYGEDPRHVWVELVND